jgi:cation transport ATPase
MPNPYGLREDDEEVAKFASRLDSTVQFETERYEQVLKKEALSFVSRDPLWYVTSVAKRATVVVFPKIGRAVFFQETLPQHVSGTLNKSLGTALLLVVDGMLGGLFLFGIWLRRKRWKELLVVMFPYLYTLLTLAPFYVAGRNIANVYFVVLMLAAVSLAYFWSLYQREQNVN